MKVPGIKILDQEIFSHKKKRAVYLFGLVSCVILAVLGFIFQQFTSIIGIYLVMATLYCAILANWENQTMNDYVLFKRAIREVNEQQRVIKSIRKNGKR